MQKLDELDRPYYLEYGSLSMLLIKGWLLTRPLLGLRYVKISDETCKKILQSVMTSGELKKKTNKELAELLTNSIWADSNIFTPLSDLLSEVIDRLGKVNDE